LDTQISKSKAFLFAKDWYEAIVIAVVLAFFIRTFIVQPYKIPTGSMYPTLQQGDRILVNKFMYRFREPRRGEVIVFNYPEDVTKQFIKRLIATGQEEIEITLDGKIKINGKQITFPPISEIRYYIENTTVYGRNVLVDKDSYYVLGDNSENSRDSRFWGFVPKKYLQGKAFLLYWPINRIKIIK